MSRSKNIKMRICKDDLKICNICLKTKNESLEIFDLAMGNIILSICDECNGKLLAKTLRANVQLNERLKTQRDMKIIKRRGKEGSGD